MRKNLSKEDEKEKEDTKRNRGMKQYGKKKKRKRLDFSVADIEPFKYELNKSKSAKYLSMFIYNRGWYL